MYDDEFRWSKIIPHTFIGFVWAIVLAGVLIGGSTLLYKTFAPMQEEARREVYEETTSYVQGMRRDIENLRLEYLREEDETMRMALRSTLLRRTDDFDIEELGSDLQEFVAELRVAREEEARAVREEGR